MHYMTYNMALGKKVQEPNLSSLLMNLLEVSLCQQTDLILLDFSKAFDKVSHTKLLFKVHQHGITQNNLSWIKAFLLGPSQCVALEGENRLKFRSRWGGCLTVQFLDQSCFFFISTYPIIQHHRSDYLLCI